MSLHPHDLFAPSGPTSHLDPVLFGMLTAVVEEESALAYEEGFADGLRTARFRPGAESEADLPEEPEW